MQEGNPYGLGVTSPFTLDVLRVLAGISNSERVEKEVKKASDDIIKTILSIMEDEITPSNIELLK